MSEEKKFGPRIEKERKKFNKKKKVFFLYGRLWLVVCSHNSPMWQTVIDCLLLSHGSPFFLHHLQSSTKDNCDKIYVKMGGISIIEKKKGKKRIKKI